MKIEEKKKLLKKYLTDFCESQQCHDIQNGTTSKIDGVESYIKSVTEVIHNDNFSFKTTDQKLSTLNPNKIDEERFYKIWNKKDISEIEDILSEYNSTCKDHQVLQPLPSEIPKELRDKYIKDDSYFLKDMWQELIKHYGTPTKKELVSVEELAKEIKNIYVPCSEEKKLSYVIAQHLVNKYGLNPPKRDEFPFNLKKGDKFKIEGSTRVLDSISLNATDGVSFPLSECTPYTEPSLHDKVKEKLGSDLYEEFMKEVKNGTK